MYAFVPMGTGSFWTEHGVLLEPRRPHARGRSPLMVFWVLRIHCCCSA